MNLARSNLLPREQLSETQLKEALDHCAQEPIHIPGSIQPHGILIVVSEEGIVQQISANAVEFLGIAAETCLNRPLSEFFDIETIRLLHSVRSKSALQPIQSIVISIRGKSYDAVAHQSADAMVVEIEPLNDKIPYSVYYDQLRNYSIGMHKAKSLTEVFNHIVECIRLITGFARVKLYRFDQDWNGEVVAESRADFMPSYKGLHFPASDIPEQARKLYMQNYLRLIADTQYKPVPVIPAQNPATGKPLDMSLSMLRSVSPVHIQYLENINIHASMSVSIIQNGKLWGLIACHHPDPLHVPYLVRNICEIMGHIFSAQLSTIEDLVRREAQNRRELLVRGLASSLDRNTQIDLLMEESHSLAMEALDADGMVVKAYVHVLRYGNTPSEDIIAHLVDWLSNRQGDPVFHTEDAASFFKDIPELSSLTGGILAIPISSKSHDYIIWLRAPIVEEVSWAGNPEKPVEQTKAGYRLTPRSSFELWKKQVLHRSSPWLDDDIRTARAIVSILLESEKLSAQQANLAKTEFLANMSHEIRTPMNAIIGLTRLLSKSQPVSEKQREMLKTLMLSADNLMDLINDLLDISKIESRTMELEAIPFSIRNLLQEVISMTSVKAREKGIYFELEDNFTFDKIFTGDPTRIRQIILNLCSNAVKFTENGGVRIVVSSESAKSGKTERLCIRVQDTGIGIAAQKIESIFHKFIQADSSVSRRYGGTGLGLAITKMLTEAMGGTITVKSEPGKGSEFIVFIDLEVGKQSLTIPLPAGAPVFMNQDNQKRVLLVEDYEPNILVASMYLDSFGYDYDVAYSGPEAIERYKSNRYSVILMDVQMPELNGFDTTEVIRQYEKSHNLPRTVIIGMTAHALLGDKERCIAAGMDEYISKPIHEDELRGKLAIISR